MEISRKKISLRDDPIIWNYKYNQPLLKKIFYLLKFFYSKQFIVLFIKKITIIKKVYD